MILQLLVDYEQSLFFFKEKSACLWHFIIRTRFVITCRVAAFCDNFFEKVARG